MGKRQTASRDDGGADERAGESLGVSERLRWAAERAAHAARARQGAAPDRKEPPKDPFVRAENEDDDGYDPYSDRPASPGRLFERSPWE